MQLVVVGALARLLTPRDFGIVGSATIFGGLANLLAQMGVAPAIVQSRSITDRHLRLGFTVAVLLGLLMSGLMSLTAPRIALFFSVPELVGVLRIYSASFVLAALGAVSEALLQREMAFKSLMRINVLSYLIGYSVVAVGLAYSGAGAWALIYGLIGQRLMQTVLAYSMRPHPVKPLFAVAEARSMVRFGVGYTLAQLFNYGANQGDYIVIGRLLGVPSLGVYSRAYQLMMMPTKYFGQALVKVLFPAMAAIQDDRKRLRRAYLRSVGLISSIITPLCAIMLICGPEIVRIALGGGWDSAIVPFQLLCTGVLFRTIYKLSDSLAEATGAVFQRAGRELFYLSCVIGGTTIGSRWELPGVSVGVVLAIFLNYLIGAEMSARALQIRRRELLSMHAPGIGLAVGVGLVAWPVRAAMITGGFSSAGVLVGVFLALCVAGTIVVWVNPSPTAKATSQVGSFLLQILPPINALSFVRSVLTARVIPANKDAR